MELKLSGIITLVYIVSCYFAYSDAVNIAAIGSFVFPPRSIQCHACQSLLTDDCKDIANSSQKHKMVEQCRPEAKGCLKHLVQTSDGYNLTFRECYYEGISFFFKNLKCEGLPKSVFYAKEKCYKCRGNLCNHSDHVYSTFGISFHIFVLFVTTYIFSYN